MSVKKKKSKLPYDDTFWQEASEETLKQTWGDKEDDIYARLLDE